MTEGIAVALIVNGIGLIGTIVSVLGSNKKTANDIKLENDKTINSIKLENAKVVNEVRLEFVKYKASNDEKITELTREVREHNNFAKRMPVVENDIKHVENDIKHIEEKIVTLRKGE